MEGRIIKLGTEGSISGKTAEVPMESQMESQTLRSIKNVVSVKPCTHGRLIDEVLTRSGKPTGQVRCLECGATFDDPYLGER
jgi:hypothetical protein